jgi:arabinose-5-phosphate isomerase
MKCGERLPLVQQGYSLSESIYEITRKRLGILGVIDLNGRLIGAFTDGDLRRCLDKKLNLDNTKIEQVMTRNPVTIHPNEMAITALQLMNERKITSLFVTDISNNCVGIIGIHHLLENKIFLH